MRGKRNKAGKGNGWVPVAGELASYAGRSGRLLKDGRKVLIVAEASGKRTMVRAIGHSGKLVTFPVLTANLRPPQPSLF